MTLKRTNGKWSKALVIIVDNKIIGSVNGDDSIKINEKNYFKFLNRPFFK